MKILIALLAGIAVMFGGGIAFPDVHWLVWVLLGSAITFHIALL